MFDIVRQHDDAITNHDERKKEIKANTLSLENTMMKESRESQDVVEHLEMTVVHHK